MAKKYTWSKTNSQGETFTAVEFDSFDEAIRSVEKGIADRALQLINRVEQKAAIEKPKSET